MNRIHGTLLRSRYRDIKKKKRKKEKGRERTNYYICTLVTYNNKTNVTKILVVVDLLTFKQLKNKHVLTY